MWGFTKRWVSLCESRVHGYCPVLQNIQDSVVREGCQCRPCGQYAVSPGSPGSPNGPVCRDISCCPWSVGAGTEAGGERCASGAEAAPSLVFISTSSSSQLLAGHVTLASTFIGCRGRSRGLAGGSAHSCVHPMRSTEPIAKATGPWRHAGDRWFSRCRPWSPAC